MSLKDLTVSVISCTVSPKGLRYQSYKEVTGMSMVPSRKLVIRPMHLGPYTRAIVLPSWWLKLNDNPKTVEVSFTMDSLVIRPIGEEKDSEPASEQPIA